MPNIVSVSFYPRYAYEGRYHLGPVVMEACRRVLYDNGTVDMSTITAAAYEAATGDEIESVCAALDRHPRERR
jgi:hypothetical protein